MVTITIQNAAYTLQMLVMGSTLLVQRHLLVRAGNWDLPQTPKI